jgi:hypothetical protein
VVVVGGSDHIGADRGPASVPLTAVANNLRLPFEVDADRVEQKVTDLLKRGRG